MKRFLIKSGIAVFSVMIFFGILMGCLSSAGHLEYDNVAQMAEENAARIKPMTDPPGQDYGKADESLLRKEGDPCTAEDFSYMVLDGIRFDMPCTVGELAEHFGMFYFFNLNKDSGAAYVCRDSVPFLSVNFNSNNSEPPYTDCVVEKIHFVFPTMNRAFCPEIIVGGSDITADDFVNFQTEDPDKEYNFQNNYIVFENGEKGYICIDVGYRDISVCYYDSIERMTEDVGADELKKTSFSLNAVRIELPESYDPETYEPVSLEGMDLYLSALGDGLLDEPSECIYDVLLSEGGYAGIFGSGQIDESHAYIQCFIDTCNDDDPEKEARTVTAVFCDGQQLGEALIVMDSSVN